MIWQYVYHQPIVLTQGLAMYGVAICLSDTLYHQPIVLIPLIVIAKSGPSLACYLTRRNISTENQKYVKTNHTTIKNTNKNKVNAKFVQMKNTNKSLSTYFDK